jgi:predicted ATPase
VTLRSPKDDSSLPGSFVGRKRELAELRAGLGDVPTGHGHLFLLSGEPGIGKTRLADEFGRMAVGQGVRVAWGRCWGGGGAPAYWPWIQILRSCLCDSGGRPSELTPDSESPQVVDLLPEIFEHNRAEAPKLPKPALGDPSQERFRLFDSAARLLKRLSSFEPLVILLDDLHAADEPSLQMLIFVARELKSDRVMLIGTYRDNEVRSSPTISRLFADLAREGTELPLRGLSRTEIEEYLNQHTSFRPRPDRRFRASDRGQSLVPGRSYQNGAGGAWRRT